MQHFRQAFESKAYKDRIYNQLKINEIRDKTLNGELELEECNDEDVHSML